MIEPDGYVAAWVCTIEPIDGVEDELRRLVDMANDLTARSEAMAGRIKALIEAR